jgi:NADH:ubiquinone oxidoreductase subunit 4 (subunit M)
MIPLYSLAGLIVFVGVYPTFLINVITPSLTQVMQAASAFVK